MLYAIHPPPLCTPSIHAPAPRVPTRYAALSRLADAADIVGLAVAIELAPERRRSATWRCAGSEAPSVPARARS